MRFMLAHIVSLIFYQKISIIQTLNIFIRYMLVLRLKSLNICHIKKIICLVMRLKI